MACETIKYIVKKGDNLWNITKAHGFPPRDWRKIYEAKYNDRLRKDRPDPNVIQPGDVVYIPQSSPKDIAAKEKAIIELGKKFRKLQAHRAWVVKLLKQLDLEQAAENRKVAELTKSMKEAERLSDDAYNSGMSYGPEFYGGNAYGQKMQWKAARLKKEIKKLQDDGADREKARNRVLDSLEKWKREIEKADRAVKKEKDCVKAQRANPYE